MKKIFLILMATLCPILTIAQGGLRITWPLERSVFQRSSAGTASFSITGTVGYRTVFQGNSKSANIYQLNAVTGTRISNSPVNVSMSSGFNNSYATSFGPTKTFKIDVSNLNAGWYEAEVVLSIYNDCFQITDIAAKRSVKFGIGDVFLIAGQSNASGYTTNDDNVETGANYTSPQQPDAVTILNSSYETDRNYFSGPIDQEKIRQDLGLPFNQTKQEIYNETLNPFFISPNTSYFHKFDKLDAVPNSSSEGKINGSNNIYPNGQSSWTYGPMAYHMFQSGNNIPLMFFNSAIPGSHSKAWKLNGDSDWVYHQFRGALQMFGHIYGLKRVLWHQGESDNGLFNVFTSEQDYKDNLNAIISQSRTDIGNSNLGWTISRATYGGNSNPYTRTQVRNAQNAVGNNTSPSTNNLLGPDTDNIGSSGRASGQGVHFKGSTLNTVGLDWKNSNIQNGTPVEAKPLQAITVQEFSSYYRVSAPSGYNRYIWVRDNNGIYDSNKNGTENWIDLPKYSNIVEIYTCYMSMENDNNPVDGYNMKLFVSQPFVVPNEVDAEQYLTTNLSSLSFPSSNSPKQLGINAKGVKYVVTSNVNWLSFNFPCGYDGYKTIDVTATANPTTSTRNANVTITCDNGYVHQVAISQAGSTSSATSLSTLTPTSVYQEFGSLKNNLSVDGNALRINNVTYSQGLGTHAAGNIKYNLGGNYSTFTGRAGHDQETNGA